MAAQADQAHLSFYASKQVRKRLRVAAEEREIRFSELMRQMVDDFLAKEASAI